MEPGNDDISRYTGDGGHFRMGVCKRSAGGALKRHRCQQAHAYGSINSLRSVANSATGCTAWLHSVICRSVKKHSVMLNGYYARTNKLVSNARRRFGFTGLLRTGSP